MRQAVLLALGLALTACNNAPYGGPAQIWTLKALNGTPFTAPTTLTFSNSDKFSGQGPCNQYFGAFKGPYPAFNTGLLSSTRRVCPELGVETLFFEALQTVTIARVDGNTLVLSGPDATEMIFTTDA